MYVGASGASKRRCGEQFGIRGEREDEGPGVWVRGGDIVLAESSFGAADAVGGGASRATVYPDAAARD